MNELYEMCVDWDGTPEQFAQIMAVALKKVEAREIADYCECIPSSVQRWATGASRPLPGMQKEMVQWLAKR